MEVTSQNHWGGGSNIFPLILQRDSDKKGGHMLEEKSVKNWLKRRVRFTQAPLVAFLITGGIGYAAPDNVPGSGTGVAIGTGSDAQRDGVVAIGRGAHTNYAGGISYPEVNGDVAIGLNATTHSYYDQSGSVAIGKNSYVENAVGRQEKLFAFKQTGFNGLGFGNLPQKPDKVVTGVAIGDNTYVRTGGTMVGSHNYRGKIGDITVSTDSYAEKRIAGLGIYSTTLGANSFTNGAAATTSGALNVISSDYDGNNATKATKNFGATITGSLNSIESATSSNNVSGLANAVVGTANRTNNSNGSLIFGAGNEITNSIAGVNSAAITGSAFGGGPASITRMSEDVRKLVKDSKSAGSTMAFGGGNKADWTQSSAMIGVNNTITGKEDAVAKKNMINGYENTITESSENIVSGTNYSVSGEGKNILMGFNKDKNEVNKTMVVALGNNIKVNTDNSVYLGNGSTDAKGTATKGMAKYDKEIINGKEKTFAGGTPDGIVSVGSIGKERRIQNVAAGLISKDSTDAVNGSQLFAVAEELKSQAGASVTPDKITEKGNIKSSSDIKVIGSGNDRLIGTGDISLTINDKAITKEKLSENIQNKIDSIGTGKIEKNNQNTVTGDTVYNYVKQNDKKIDGKVDKEEFHNYQNTTNDRMNKMESETRHVGALSASLAALHPMQFDPLQKTQVMAGLGTYRDKQAVAVGVAHYFNENLMMTAGVSLGEDTRNKSMANVGITWKIGRDDDRKDFPERYKEGPLGAVYMMQMEMEQVMNENKDLKKLTQTQQQEIETMKQQIKMLMGKVK